MKDRDVRSAVLGKLNATYCNDASTRIVQEMGVWSGSVRIDIAVISGELWGYELKSERDTLERLPSQAKLYSRVFDRITLVIGTRHAGAAEDAVPPWWGLTIARGDSASVHLREARQALRNPAPDAYLVAQLLWRDEALAILDRLGLAVGWRSKPVKAIHERLADALPMDRLGDEVRRALKVRSMWLWQSIGHQGQVAIDTNLNPGGSPP